MFNHACLAFAGLIACGFAQQAHAQAFSPNGSAVPVIAITKPASTASYKNEPVPRPWNTESIWNMKVEGFNGNQARPIYQPLVVNQDGREILYLGNLAGQAFNPLTRQPEPNGTSIIDVTNVHDPKFLHHIPGPSPRPGSDGEAGAQMVRVCGGNTLPNAIANGTERWFRFFGQRCKWISVRAI